MPLDDTTTPTPTPAGDAGTSVFARLRLIGESTLTGNQKDLLRALLEFADPVTGGRIWASPATMGRRTSRNRRNTLRLLAELESLGVVQKQRQSRDGFNIPSDRRINFDRIWELRSSVATDTSVDSDTSVAGDTSVASDATSGAGDTGVVAQATHKHPKEHPSNIQEGDVPLKADRKAKAKAPKASPEALPDGFARFWSAWPSHERKADKRKCLAKWKADGLETRADAIVASVEAWKVSAQWQEAAGRYIPAPLVFLNKDQWEAAPPPPAAGIGSTANPAAARDREALIRRVRQLPEPELRAAADRCKVADPAKYSNWPLSYFKDNVPEAFIRELNGALDGVHHV